MKEGKFKERPPHSREMPSKPSERIDLPIREIRQLFESFKGIRISNRLAYQIQEALAHGEGEQVGPILDIDGIKVHFAVNGLPSLSSLRRALLYRCLTKSRLPDGRIDLEHTAAFTHMTEKGALKPHEILRRRLILEGITISPDQKDIRLKGGLSFEELSFDFEAPKSGFDVSEFGRKLLLAIYEFHDCSVGGTAQFFHTNEQLMLGILKRAGVEFEIPEILKKYELPLELTKQFGPAIQQQLKERLRIPMAEILRTAKARVGKKKLANRQFLDEMEERVRNFIQLVMVPEFGTAILTEENAIVLHASAWHFLQWDIGQLPVEDILNLEVVSPYEMMFSRILKHLGLTIGSCPVFFNKDFNYHVQKPYAPLIVTQETLALLFRLFKTADLLESSFHAKAVEGSPSDQDPNRSLLEIELKHLQRFPVQIQEGEVESRLKKLLAEVGSIAELHGVLSVEVKQVLAALQEILEQPAMHFFGIEKSRYPEITTVIRKTIEAIQVFVRDPQMVRQGLPAIYKSYLQSLHALEALRENYIQISPPGRANINTWAALSELYRLVYNVKGLDPPGSRRKRAAHLKTSRSGFPMLHFGPDLEEVPPERLVRATFVFPTQSFLKLNLIPPHLRTFFIIDEPDNHMGQYHLAAWAFRIHWKRRRLGQGQKSVADDYIRSLRFLRCFVCKKDPKTPPSLIFCNIDNTHFGAAQIAGGGSILERAKQIAVEVMHVRPELILEITQAEEPANEHDKYVLFTERLKS